MEENKDLMVQEEENDIVETEDDGYDYDYESEEDSSAGSTMLKIGIGALIGAGIAIGGKRLINKAKTAWRNHKTKKAAAQVIDENVEVTPVETAEVEAVPMEELVEKEEK